MPSSGSNVNLATTMHERNRELAQGSHHLWSIAGPQARAIFTKGDSAPHRGGVDPSCREEMFVVAPVWTPR